MSEENNNAQVVGDNGNRGFLAVLVDEYRGAHTNEGEVSVEAVGEDQDHVSAYRAGIDRALELYEETDADLEDVRRAIDALKDDDPQYALTNQNAQDSYTNGLKAALDVASEYTSR